MFIQNNMEFVEIDFMRRGFANFLESSQDFLKAFINSLTKEDNIIRKDQMSDVYSFSFQSQRFPFIIFKRIINEIGETLNA